MPRSEGWHGERAPRMTCPVGEVEPWFWLIAQSAHRMRNPQWPVDGMAEATLILCEEYEAASAAAAEDIERARAKRDEMAARAKALSGGAR